MNGPEWVLNPGPTDYQPSVLSTRPRRHDWKLCSFFMFLYLLYTNGSRSWEKMYVFQIHFGFTNLGSQVHSFWVIAIWIRKFWSWTPCTTYQKQFFYYKLCTTMRRRSFYIRKKKKRLKQIWTWMHWIYAL